MTTTTTQPSIACQDCATPIVRQQFGRPPKWCPACKAERLKQHNRAVHAFHCACCGKTFRARKRRLYCDMDCRAQGVRLDGSHSAKAERNYLAALQHDPCAYCGEPTDHIDHITPRRHGGPDHWTNYTAACSSCNAAKGAMPLLHFLGRRQCDTDLRNIVLEVRRWAGLTGDPHHSLLAEAQARGGANDHGDPHRGTPRLSPAKKTGIENFGGARRFVSRARP